MYLTRSRAQENPPSVAVQASCPRGASPRRATMLRTPTFLQASKASPHISLFWLVHVRCMLATQPNSFFAAEVSCNVRSEVDPPAPQVKSVNRGLSPFMRTILLLKFATPSSVFGGKYSKENHPGFVVATSSEIFLSSAYVAAMVLKIDTYLMSDA